jgi:hypothetical protein
MIRKILWSPANCFNNDSQWSSNGGETGSIFRGLGNTFPDQRWFGSGEGLQRFPVVALIAVPRTNCDIPDCCVSPNSKGMKITNQAASVS